MDTVYYLRLIVGTLALLACAAPARAQSEGKFALGANLGAKIPGSSEAHGSEGISLLWRFGHGKEGFGFHWGLNWYATDIERSVAGRTVELGDLRLKPFMAGYGYTRNVGAFSLTGALLGGFAFTSIRLTPTATDVYHDALGARSVRADSGAALVLRPEVSVWYDLNEKLGLRVNTGYMIARPHVTVSSTVGKDERSVRADMFSVKVGLAYSIF